MEILVNKGIPQILITAEGTYPYIRGGVSTWIHELITDLEEFKFGVVFLGGRREDYEGIKYELPKNLVYLSTAYIFDEKEKPPKKVINIERKVYERIKALHEGFKKVRNAIPSEVLTIEFFTDELKYEAFLYGKEAWNHLVEMYSTYAPTEPFVDYFWNIRNLHAPLWVVAEVAKKVGDFGIVHSPSTGYAGFLASMLKNTRKKPFILTEHGIYTRERKIDVMSSDWLRDKRLSVHKDISEVAHNKRVWINFFVNISRIAYEKADVIISLFDGAREIQIEYGADPKKCIVIPNGVNLKLYEKALNSRPKKIPKVVALIGRVVPIKDVKTFIKAMKLLVDKVEGVEGWVVGPTEENPEYYQECVELVKVLGLEGRVKFLGFQKTVEILPKIGVLTLTSISEGMPLIVIEGFAAGVPCVATDVGSCRQLIYGGINEEDISLGKAGEVVNVRDSSALAESYARLLTDEKFWYNCQRVALERVKRFYSREAFLENYRRLYRRFLGGRHIF